MLTGMIASLALKTGAPQGLIKGGLMLLALMLLVGGFFGAKALYDRSVIEEHDTSQELRAETAARKADTKAAETRSTDDNRIATEASALEEVRTNARTQTDSDRRLARHRCLRSQQQARAVGGPAPAC